MNTKQFGMMMLACVLWFTAHEAQAFYNPSTGRWLSRDPLGEPAFEAARQVQAEMLLAVGPNKYLFVENDPLNNHDVNGLAAGACAGGMVIDLGSVPAGATIVRVVPVAGVLYLVWELCTCRAGTCPPCPLGPPGGSRFDKVPPSAKHFPCPGSHAHLWWFETNQEPWPSCKCHYNKRERVICF